MNPKMYVFAFVAILLAGNLLWSSPQPATSTMISEEAIAEEEENRLHMLSSEIAARTTGDVAMNWQFYRLRGTDDSHLGRKFVADGFDREGLLRLRLVYRRDAPYPASITVHYPHRRQDELEGIPYSGPVVARSHKYLTRLSAKGAAWDLRESRIQGGIVETQWQRSGQKAVMGLDEMGRLRYLYRQEISR